LCSQPHCFFSNFQRHTISFEQNTTQALIVATHNSRCSFTLTHPTSAGFLVTGFVWKNTEPYLTFSFHISFTAIRAASIVSRKPCRFHSLDGKNFQKQSRGNLFRHYISFYPFCIFLNFFPGVVTSSLSTFILSLLKSSKYYFLFFPLNLYQHLLYLSTFSRFIRTYVLVTNPLFPYTSALQITILSHQFSTISSMLLFSLKRNHISALNVCNGVLPSLYYSVRENIQHQPKLPAVEILIPSATHVVLMKQLPFRSSSKRNSPSIWRATLSATNCMHPVQGRLISNILIEHPFSSTILNSSPKLSTSSHLPMIITWTRMLIVTVINLTFFQ